MTPTSEKPPVEGCSSSPTVPIRISKATSRQLRSLITKCNRKPYGRRVKADDVISQCLDLLDSEHIEKIKETTYSSQDRLEIQFKKYCQAHGSISKDRFLEILLANASPRILQTEKETV